VTAIIALGLVAVAAHIAMNGSVESSLADGAKLAIALALFGAVLGFLPFNFNPASIFMGDAGSLLMGFIVASLIVMLGESGSKWMLGAMVMFSLPVLDTALAFARRWLKGRPLFSADKHHFHHQLMARGLTVRRAVIVSYGLTIFFVVSGVLMVFLRTRYMVAFYLVLFGCIIVAAYKMGMVHERVATDPHEEPDPEPDPVEAAVPGSPSLSPDAPPASGSRVDAVAAAT
jgi:UDP-GlcNAc:undecaprenyl-phosphate GlcNAc-1-phosphate transferase